jgi:hypothetical protein
MFLKKLNGPTLSFSIGPIGYRGRKKQKMGKSGYVELLGTLGRE